MFCFQRLCVSQHITRHFDPCRVRYVRDESFCLFGVFVPPENSPFIWRRHHYRWRAAQFDLCAALMTIEQLEFCGLPHLLWHGATVHNGHLRGPLTITPITERMTLELSLPIFTTKVCRDSDSNTQPSACGADANPLRHRRDFNWFCRGWDSNTRPSACRASALLTAPPPRPGDEGNEKLSKST